MFMFERLHPKIKNLRKCLQEDMFFNNFIGLHYTTFIDFLIAAYYTVKFGAIDGNFNPYQNFYGEIISLIITSISIVVICMIIVFSFIIILTKKYDKSLKNTVGFLYDGVRMEKGRWARSYSFIIAMRRGSLVVLGFSNAPAIM